jgi:hypothetical protein
MVAVFVLAVLAGCQTVGQGVVVQTAPARAQVVAPESPVVFRFITVGDSRQEPKRAGNTAQDEIWLQATAVWSRMLHEIERQKPQALIFNGDMIYGYTHDMATIDRQYAFWRGMVAGVMERGIYVLPVPGNHEVQVPTARPEGTTIKLAQVTHENAWRANMGDLILNQPLWQRAARMPATAWDVNNAPVVGTDGISTDQRQLSYSFDSGKVHISVINTDPVGHDESAPVQWLAGDLAAAKARGARHFFIFGHKPAYTYFPTLNAEAEASAKKSGKGKEDGFATRAVLRDRFWDVIEAYGATYFCGHQHVYHASQPRRASGGKAWQVIVGSAGSPLTVKAGTSTDPADSMHAWAEVSVRADGSVAAEVRGIDGPAGNVIPLDRWMIASPQ